METKELEAMKPCWDHGSHELAVSIRGKFLDGIESIALFYGTERYGCLNTEPIWEYAEER